MRTGTTSTNPPRLPVVPAAARVSSSIVRIYNTFLAHADLSPSPAINAAFSELVELCIQPYDTEQVRQIVSDKRVSNFAPHLRALCSTGEYKLESHWATRILVGKTRLETATALRAFPYYDNYLDLSRLEISALHTAHPDPITSVCFIGSGPLPMTSLCLSTLLTPPPVRIHNIDCDPHAIAVSSQLCKNLGASSMTFQLADASEVEDLSNFEVVFLAGLVGETKDVKMQVLRNVVARCRQHTLVVLRSAHGVRRLLYQEIDVGLLLGLGLEVLLVVHPWGRVVNSVVVCRVIGNNTLGSVGK